jgi:large subunit ribosomal protein L18
MLPKILRHQARATRVRARIVGTAAKPRLSVFRSNAKISVQAIDDVAAKTIASANDLKLAKGTKAEKAAQVGTAIAQALSKLGVTTVVFDRGGYHYHGRVKALAEAARAAGLQF